MSKFIVFGLMALILNLWGYAPYFRDIIANRVKPQRVTWTLWTILSLIAAINQVRNGGGWATTFAISTFVLVTGVLLLSIKKGVGGASRLDLFSLAIAAILFVWWAFSRDSIYSTYLAIGIDSIGAALTTLKAFHQPETEAYFQWITSGVAAAVSLLALEKHSVVLFAYPAYIMFANAVIVSAKYFGHKVVPRKTVT